MEKQRRLASAGARSVYLETLSEQDHPDAARHLGGLDSGDGDYLFSAAGSSISFVRTGPFILGLVADLHDQSIRGEDRSGRAVSAGGDRNVEGLKRPRPIGFNPSTFQRI